MFLLSYLSPRRSSFPYTQDCPHSHVCKNILNPKHARISPFLSYVLNKRPREWHLISEKFNNLFVIALSVLSFLCAGVLTHYFIINITLCWFIHIFIFFYKLIFPFRFKAIEASKWKCRLFYTSLLSIGK